jgi:hypothetical protein
MFWSDMQQHLAVVRLQDRANQIEETVECSRRSLTPIFTIMLPRNPLLENFHQLLDTFRSSQRVHRLIKLQLIAGAQFALTWLRKWKPRLDFDTISKGVLLKKHLEAMLEPVKRMINHLLEADAGFFKEHHYLDPVLSGPASKLNVA